MLKTSKGYGNVGTEEVSAGAVPVTVKSAWSSGGVAGAGISSSSSPKISITQT